MIELNLRTMRRKKFSAELARLSSEETVLVMSTLFYFTQIKMIFVAVVKKLQVSTKQAKILKNFSSTVVIAQYCSVTEKDPLVFLCLVELAYYRICEFFSKFNKQNFINKFKLQALSGRQDININVVVSARINRT